ncbi:hypothetical protein EDF22_1708 [Rathayibacter sp. PhB127]|nr:hypothetical protein EDF22_1708 [Rathayibacter sp. PhB127]
MIRPIRVVIVVVLIALFVVGLALFSYYDTPTGRVTYLVSAVLFGIVGAIGVAAYIALPRLRTTRVVRRRLPEAVVFVASNQYDVLRELSAAPAVDPAIDGPLGDLVTVSIAEDGLTVWSAGAEPRPVRQISSNDIHSVEPDFVEAHLGKSAILHVRAQLDGELTSLSLIPTIERFACAFPSSFHRAHGLANFARSVWKLDD